MRWTQCRLYSNYSTGTVRDTETDTVSYFGLDNMVWTNRWTQFYSTGTVRRLLTQIQPATAVWTLWWGFFDIGPSEVCSTSGA